MNCSWGNGCHYGVPHTSQLNTHTCNTTLHILHSSIYCFNGHFPSARGFASWPCILLLHLFLDYKSSWDRSKLFISSSTQSHQVFLGWPHDLFHRHPFDSVSLVWQWKPCCCQLSLFATICALCTLPFANHSDTPTFLRPL